MKFLKITLIILIIAVTLAVLLEIGLEILTPSLTIKHPHLQVLPNPEFPGHDKNGFRNKSVPNQADIVCLGDSQTYTMAIVDSNGP